MANKVISIGVRFLFVAVCTTYALWGTTPGVLFGKLGSYSPYMLLMLCAYSLASFAPAAERLHRLTPDAAGRKAALNATLIGFAVNNVAPAKVGEVAKILYLNGKAGLSSRQGVEAVFWERFMDLNALLLLGGLTTYHLGKDVLLLPLLSVSLAIWAFLLANRKGGRFASLVARIIPFERMRIFFLDVSDMLRKRSGPRFHLTNIALTAMAWAMQAAVVAFVLNSLGGLECSPLQIITVFTVSAVGYAIPSSPGAVGVYEASFVMAMGWIGVGKDEALTLGLVSHAIQLIPPTVCGLALILVEGIPLRTIFSMKAGGIKADAWKEL